MVENSIKVNRSKILVLYMHCLPVRSKFKNSQYWSPFFFFSLMEDHKKKNIFCSVNGKQDRIYWLTRIESPGFNALVQINLAKLS